MRRIRKLTPYIAAFLLGGISVVSSAQQGPMHASGKAHMLERLKTADTNGDGMISREEANALPKLSKHFDEIDTDKNGLISLQEFETAMKKLHALRHGDLLKQFDKDGDGRISREEAQAAPRLAKHFDEIDTNKDGYLSNEELASARQMATDRMFARIDTDGDGKISRTEAQRFPRLAAHFDQIDTDKDGYLTRAELKAAHQRRLAGVGPS